MLDKNIVWEFFNYFIMTLIFQNKFFLVILQLLAFHPIKKN